MVKCVVSGCPNRKVDVNRGVLNRPAKRFFSFPKDPARVKVWLAALRETNKQDPTEQQLICEDHFLPEDISSGGVSTDAIPLMPPCLDGHLGTISLWGAEASEEEDQWADRGGDGDDDEGGGDELLAVKPPAVDPLQQDSGAQKTPGSKTTSKSLHQRKKTVQTRRAKQDWSLGILTQHFLQLLLAAPDGLLDLRQVMTKLNICRQRVYDVTNILCGINVIKKPAPSRVKWIGSCPISSFLWKNQENLRREVENMKLVEDTLDTLIRSCTLQLLALTQDQQNSEMAYVTHQDVSRLAALQEQTVIVVKAPEETKLEILAPKQDSIRVHMKGGVGPIAVLTCEVATGEKSDSFVTLEESRITTEELHTGSSSPQSATN
ncbi:transcription factor E2F6-like [Seriola lalandi dorsalis]|uniref:transcription factor E2F6-like n=1 Tax=Seriola lalandi dorsalis TaxID=1841481 RepID=UPI000C6F55AE|nr:transcription factor E2F6-like [Seriola lalandi dorsalis]